MGITREKLEFHNVMCMRTQCEDGMWMEQAKEFRSFLLAHEVFVTGPVVVRMLDTNEETNMTDVEIYLPTYQRMNVENNDKFSYIEDFVIEDGIKLRHNDMSDSIELSEMVILDVASKLGVKVNAPFYHIYLPVYQEFIIDIYAPIAAEEE